MSIMIPKADNRKDGTHMNGIVSNRSQGTAIGTIFRIAACATLLAGCVFPARAQRGARVDPVKEKSIRTLLALTGSAKLGQQVMDQIIETFRRGSTNAPPAFWDEMRRKLKADEMVDMIVPIYARYYSKQELDQLITFYRSPIGRKVAATLPMIVRESMAVGQQWGRAKAQEVIAEMKKRNYALPRM